MIDKNLQYELGEMLDSDHNDSVSLLDDCRAIAKSYGLSYGYIIKQATLLSYERISNESKEL